MSMHASIFGMRAPALALVLTAVLAFSNAAAAFSPADSLKSMGDSQREVLDAIAARDAGLRDAALLATLYPDTLVHVELIQARSSAAFELRVKQLDREHQEEIWEIVRAEGALRDIVEGGPKSKAQLKVIAARYPERIRAIFAHLGAEHFKTLEEAQAIKAAADVEFDNEIASLPEVPRDAFRELITDPSLLAMLGRSPSAVSTIGEAFDADPDATLALVDKLALEVAESNVRSEADWRDSFGDDPDAQAELESAARSYADEYGYDYDELTSRDVEVNVHIHQHAYPYWFGYPHWYASWDPWGVWYPVLPHFGFYYGHGGFGHQNTVFFGLPSLHFVNWYYGGHYRQYPRLSRHIDYHHSRYVRAYRPLHRQARLRHYGGGRHGGNWAPQRLSARAVHAADLRAERRERGIERRDTRREHMTERRETRRGYMTERRDKRRESGIERRDTRRQNSGDRRGVRRERAVDRKAQRRDHSDARATSRAEAAVERRTRSSARRPIARAESRAQERTARRFTSRDAAQSGLEARREARTSQAAELNQVASSRSVERRSTAQARTESRSRARATRAEGRDTRAQARSAARPQRQRVAHAQVTPQQQSRTGEPPVVSQGPSPRPERAAGSQTSGQERRRVSDSGKSRSTRKSSSANRGDPRSEGGRQRR